MKNVSKKNVISKYGILFTIPLIITLLTISGCTGLQKELKANKQLNVNNESINVIFDVNDAENSLLVDCQDCLFANLDYFDNTNDGNS